MFKKAGGDDLFLSDIGSLSQIYDKDQHFGKNFKANTKKRDTRISKSGEVLTDKNGQLYVRACTNINVSIVEETSKEDIISEDASRVNLYDDDDADIRIPPMKMASNEAYSDDRIYDDFELNTKPNDSKPADSVTKTRNDAPWLNREKVPDNDATRLLEYERSFKNDQFHDAPYPPRTQKPYPKEIETQAKSARSLQRKQNKFDENYSKWAYDDEYDNEDKSDKDASLYDPEHNHDESGRSFRLFSQPRFANPENPFSELLDENYPNAGDLPPYKVGKIRVENKLEEKLKASLKEPKTLRATKSEDDDVIILDDSLPIGARVRNEVNKKIKISFTSEPKSKSTAQETIFTEEHVSRDPRLQKKEEAAQSAKKIPILEGSSIPMIAPTAANIRPITPGAPMISQAAPLAPFSNPPFPMLDRNYYNVFGGNVMNEMHATRNFIPGANVAEFFSTTAMQFNPSVGWIPVNPQASAPPAAAVVEKAPTPKDAVKAEKINSEDAVKEEIRQQNRKLMDQRDQYLQKFNSLNEELSKLKKQKKSLADKKTHQAEEFLRENDKLQTEILSKIKAVKNIIDMLSKIIKDEGMKGSSSDTADEGSKKSSVELDDNAKEPPKSKRKHSRSRSKSRHRSRSKSRHRSRSKSRHRSRSRSRGRRSRSRSRGRRSRSRSRYRRRSRSRDNYYRRRRSNSRDRKKTKRDKEEKKPTTTPAPAAAPTPAPAAPGVTLITVVEPPPIPAPVAETKPAPVVEKPKPKDPKLSDRFKSSFEEIYDRPVPRPKPAEVQKPPPVTSRFSDEPKSVQVPAPPPAREKSKPVKQLEAAKGWARNTADSINYVYFDPEIHWCRVCNAFPKTAKEYLLHLHSAEHKQVLATNNLIDYPWHKNQTDTKKPINPGAPTERIPIRGLPFFVSATAWYCKLCDQWMGDLHCASAHLKSDQHENNYMTFLESNPKWEEHWLDSRAKALQAQHVVKAPEPVTPAYSSETYIKPAPIPPPPPPLQLRPGTGEKKRSSSTSSSISSSSTSTSSSSGRSSHKKKKKSKRKRSKSKDRKRSVEKETKFKMVVTDAKKARELAKMSHVVAPPPQPEPASAPSQGTVSFNVEEEDKFVQEWMNPARSKSKEKDLQELKKNLIKNREPPVLPALPPEKPKPATDTVAKKPPSKGRSPERERSRRDDDHRGGSDRSGRSRFEDRSRRSPRDDSRYKKSNGSDSKSSDRYRSSFDRSRDGKSGGSGPKKTIIDRRFPFIGKMPSKNSLKKTAAEQQSDSKSKPEKKPEKVEPVPSDPAKPKDPLTESIQKQLAEYDRPNDVNVAVVDMDINEEEDEPVVSIVVDDNISRKKDFDETLKLLYPENRPKSGSGGQNQTSQAASAGLPANLSQDYLVSLIKSTIKENQLNLKDGNENSQIMQIASSMKEILASTTNLADIPIPVEERPVHISSEEQLYNVPLPDEPETSGVELEPEPAPPGTMDDSASAKKKKNPISQKKRRHMRKIREKLEEQEKLLQQKIEERTGQNEPEEAECDVSVTSSNTADEAQNEVEEASSTPGPATVMDDDLMMLGIDEEDSAALLF